MTHKNPTLYVISGAGLSAESGIPTFRDSGGTWDNHDLNKVCSYLTWKDNREAVFEFYAERKRMYSSAKPCDAHKTLADWQKQWGTERVKLLTQNVDLLLEAAGASEVVHLHGRMDLLHCTACGTKHEIGDALFDANERCPKCNSLKGVKPGIVFFHEPAPEYIHLGRMYKHIKQEDILLVVGTNLEVVTVRHLIPAWRIGHDLNIQVNPKPAEENAFGINVAKTASDGLAEIENRIAMLMG